MSKASHIATNTATHQSGDMLLLGAFDQPMLIFGGPYSNLAATEAMQSTAQRLQIPAERIICTGDLVAYCADAWATSARIKDWGVHTVMGNCEESLATGALDCGCGFEADSACSLLATGWYPYAAGQVTQEQCQWMGQLPRTLGFTLAGRRFQVVHGALDQINRFVFQGSDAAVFQQQWQKTTADVVIGGHCGLPFHRAFGDRHWLNAGVIGMPANDGTPDGWYMLLSPETAADQLEGVSVRVSWHRLSYPVEQTQQAMAEAGLNTPYKTALATGLWPNMDILPEEEREACGQRLQLPEYWL